jgi:hypothetical protein
MAALIRSIDEKSRIGKFAMERTLGPCCMQRGPAAMRNAGRHRVAMYFSCGALL